MRIGFDKDRRLLVWMVAAVAFIYAYCQYYLLPILEEYRAVDQIVRRNEEKLEDLRKIEAGMEGFWDEMERLQSNITALEVLVPSNPRTPEIITHLESCSKTANVALKSITFERFALAGQDETEMEEEYVEIPIKIVVSGYYENIIAFLEELECSDRLYNINGFSIVSNSWDHDILTMDIDLCSYALSYDDG